jgi:hypothetical protein
LNELVEKVRRELERYEHPLFAFRAERVGEGIEVEIRFKPPLNHDGSGPAGVEVHRYQFQLQPREVESSQFSWDFQRQLYDCLHDYVIEMFIRNPQMKEY